MRLTSQTFGQTMIFLTLLTGCKDLLPQSTSEELETKESGTETCASELSDRTYLRLSEDLSEPQSGLINFGDGLIEQLRIELLKTYPPETAVAIANSARNELDKHVGTLIIPEGTSIEPLGEVAAPVVRGAMFGLLDPCAGASSSEQGLGIAGHIVSGSTASLNGRTSELSAVETSEVIGSITNSSVKALPDVGLGGDLAAASVPALTKAAVASLPNAGVSDVIIKGSLQKIAQGATSALSTNGFDAQSVIAISGSVAGSAIADIESILREFDASMYKPILRLQFGVLQCVLGKSCTGKFDRLNRVLYLSQ